MISITIITIAALMTFTSLQTHRAYLSELKVIEAPGKIYSRMLLDVNKKWKKIQMIFKIRK